MFYAGGVEPWLQQRVGDPVQFAAMQRQPPFLCLFLPPKCLSLPPYAVLLRDGAHILSSFSAPFPLKASLSLFSFFPAKVPGNEDLAPGWLVLRVKLLA